MLRKFTAAFAITCFLLFPLIAAAAKASEKPQVIKLQRFRKALWKVHVTVKGKPGDFLLDTGGGVTLLAAEFSKGIDCKFWGRNTGYNMFGKKIEGPHCDNVQINAGDVALTPVNVGKIDFGDQFSGDKKPDGLLSLDAFDGKAFTLDQAAGTLTIDECESCEADEGNERTALPYFPRVFRKVPERVHRRTDYGGDDMAHPGLRRRGRVADL